MEKIFPKDLENIINEYTQKTEYEIYLGRLEEDLDILKSSLSSCEDYYKMKIDMECLKDQMEYIKPVLIGYEKIYFEKLKRMVLNMENQVRIIFYEQ